MDLPQKGTAARKLFDYISSQSDGATQDTMAEATSLKEQMVATRLAELADKGFIVKDGQRMAGPDGQVAMDIWRASSSHPVESQQREPPKPPKLTPQACPACGETVYQHLNENHGSVFVGSQKRFVAFAGPPELYDENGVPKKPLNVYDEYTGQLCFGREIEESERAYFKEHKKFQVPYAIGYVGHLKTCQRWDVWLSGKAAKKEEEKILKWDYESKRMEFVKREPKKLSDRKMGGGGDSAYKRKKPDKQSKPKEESATPIIEYEEPAEGEFDFD